MAPVPSFFMIETKGQFDIFLYNVKLLFLMRMRCEMPSVAVRASIALQSCGAVLCA